MNGNVSHSQLVNPRKTGRFFLNTPSSCGIGHKKHQRDVTFYEGYGVAGQDVYKHSSDSICVCDGHGQNGLYAALHAIKMVAFLKTSPQKIQINVKSVENEIRNSLVQQLHSADFEYSGSTFTCMRFVTSGDRRWAVTVNIGDSEALLVYSNKIQICSVAHNWDNFTLYKRYVRLVKQPKNVCYNRWNASKYRMKDKDGNFRPIMMYDIHGNKASVNQENAKWVSELHIRKNKPRIKNGTQSVRIFSELHENWGSCVMLYGRARGQNMASIGDTHERNHTKVPMDTIHIYIHEIPANETVIGIVQSDGISNMRSLRECGKKAWSSRNANDYISGIINPRDDMSVAMFVSEPVIE
jgi:serine/threonine protein phosphatase PrpC